MVVPLNALASVGVAASTKLGFPLLGGTAPALARAFLLLRSGQSRLWVRGGDDDDDDDDQTRRIGAVVRWLAGRTAEWARGPPRRTFM